MLDYKLKIRDKYEQQVGKNDKIVEYLGNFGGAKVIINRFINIWVVPQVFYIEVARVETKESWDQYDDKADKSAGYHGEHRQDKDKTANHAID